MKKLLTLFLILCLPLMVSGAELTGVQISGVQVQEELPDYLIPLEVETDTSIDLNADMGSGTVVRDGTPYRLNDDGIYKTVTANNLRYESVNGRRMVYLEPFHLNLVPYSSDFSNWTTSNVSIVADVTGPDDGANTATTITDDNAGVADYIYIAVNPATDDEKYCYTAHIQEGTSADLTLILRDTGAAATRAEIDFEWVAGDLTVKNQDTGTGAVKQIGSTDWWKAILYVPASTIVEANAHEVRIYPTENGRQAAETTIVWGVDLLEHPVDFRPIPTTGSSASINDEGGNPYYGLPSDTFAEALGGEEATGTTTIGNVYKITADVGNHFYAGSATGEYFEATSEIALDASNKVQEVTNASNGLPPVFTLVTLWMPGYDYDDMPSPLSSGIISLQNSTASLLRNRFGEGNGTLHTHDGTTSAFVPLFWQADTPYKIAIQAYVESNVYFFRVGVEPIGSEFNAASWGDSFNYDGAFTVGGNFFQLAFDLFGPMWMGDIQLWRRVLTDAEINAR